MPTRIVALCLFVLAVGASPAPGQQVLVDDPTSVPVGAAQLEAWHSTEESWIAPGVRIHPRLEVAGGVAFLDTGNGDRRSVEYSLEGKVLVRPGTTHRVGLAAVGGAATSHLGVPDGRPATLFGYGVVSQDLLPGRLTSYQNAGWLHERNGPHQLIWGARLDWSPLDRFTLIGEAYGEGRSDPSLQASLRTALLPNRIEMDVSVTRAGPFDDRNTWGTIGLTFMSTSLYGSENRAPQ
jgi:hypothetical protein